MSLPATTNSKIIIKVPPSMRKRNIVILKRPTTSSTASTSTSATTISKSKHRQPSTPRPKLARGRHEGLAIPDTVQADTPPSTTPSTSSELETPAPTSTRRTQIVIVGSWRAKWIASMLRKIEQDAQDGQGQKQCNSRQHLTRRKVFLTRLYQKRADNADNDGEPFLRHMARTYMADLRLRAVRNHLRNNVMTPGDYAEMMIWYRRAQKESR